MLLKSSIFKTNKHHHKRTGYPGLVTRQTKCLSIKRMQKEKRKRGKMGSLKRMRHRTAERQRHARWKEEHLQQDAEREQVRTKNK